MANGIDFDSITAGPNDIGFENISGSDFDFDSITDEPEVTAFGTPDTVVSKLFNFGVDVTKGLLGVDNALFDDTMQREIVDVIDSASDSILNGDALLRGLDITFSPISGTAAAVKAKILGQDAQDAFTNRIVQSLGVAEIVNEELGGNTNIAMTPEDIKFEAVGRGESDSITNLEIAGLVFTDIAEVLIPVPGLKALDTSGIARTGKKLEEVSLKIGQKVGKNKFFREVIVPLKNKGIDSMNKFISRDGPKKTVSFFERASRSVGSRLKTLGEPGKELFERMRLVRDKSEIMAGKFINDLEKNLTGLTLKEADDMVKVLDGQPISNLSDKVKKAVESERRRLNIVNDLADDILGGTELPVKRENYFPHIFGQDDLIRADFKKKAIDQMMDSGEFANRVEAQRVYEGFGAELKGRKYGNLETSRLNNVDGWITNPKEALSIYYTRAFRRINEAKYLGVDDDIAKGLVNQIDEIGADANFAQRAIENFTGKNKLDDSLNSFLNKVNGFETVTKLGFAQISNAPQGLVNTAFNANIKTAVQAFLKSFTKEGKEFATRSGAILSSTLDEFARIGAEGGVKGSMATRFLRNTGFTAAESKNRVIAALGGKMRAEWAFDIIKTGGKDSKLIKKARDVLDDLNISKAELDDALRRGALSEDELLQAGLSFSNTTQFRSDVLSLPEFFRSGWGRTFTQFKSFAFNHSRFLFKVVKDDIKAAARGDLKALGSLLAKVGFASVIGEVPRDLRMLLKGESVAEREVSLGRLVENFGAIGGLGIFSDVHNSLQFGQSGVFGFLTGPAVSDAVRASTNILGPLANGDIKRAAIGLLTEPLRTIPGFGTTISKQVKESLK